MKRQASKGDIIQELATDGDRVTKKPNVDPFAGNGFKVVSKLGDGASGKVWEVYNETTDEHFAVKEMKSMESYNHELDMMIELSKNKIGPKFISCFTTGFPADKGFIVMELWEGHLEWNERLNRKMLYKLRKQIDKMHKLGLIHGDIVERNILVKRENGKVVDVTLTDFGWTREATFYKKFSDEKLQSLASYKERLQKLNEEKAKLEMDIKQEFGPLSTKLVDIYLYMTTERGTMSYIEEVGLGTVLIEPEHIDEALYRHLEYLHRHKIKCPIGD